MGVCLDGCFCSLAAAVKALWCNDPFLSQAIPGEKVFEFGFGGTAPTLPYAIILQGPATEQLRLGDDDYFSQIPITLKIYASKDIWRIGKQARLLFSNVGCLESLEGSVCGARCFAGPVIQLPNGPFVVEHTIRLSVTEHRGPQRLRMI